MAKTDQFNDIERSAILILAEVSGYPVRTLTELVCPLVAGNINQGIHGLGILEKRIERLIRRAKLQKKPFSYDEKGTYILHSLTLKHGNRKYYLLLIMELYSGLIYAKAYTRLTRKSLRPAIEQATKMFIQPCKKIVLVTHVEFDAALHLVEFAAVIKVPFIKLDAERNTWMPKRLEKIPLERHKIPSESITPIVLPATYISTTELNKVIFALADKYNQVKREHFPRSSSLIAPVDKLFVLLKENAQKNKKPITQWSSYLQSVTFGDCPVAESDRFDIFGGRPKLQFRASLDFQSEWS